MEGGYTIVKLVESLGRKWQKWKVLEVWKERMWARARAANTQAKVEAKADAKAKDLGLRLYPACTSAWENGTTRQ